MMMILLTSIMIAILGVKGNTPLGNVRIDHGILKISGYNKCFIDMNGFKTKLQLNRTDYIHDSFAVGLLKWKCDADIGYEVIDIECKDCGVYCSYNQQFEKCKSPYATIIMGIIIALLMIVVIGFIIATCFKEKATYIILLMIFYKLTINDRNRANKIRKLNDITGTKHQILFRYIHTSCVVLNDMIMDYRLKLRMELTGDEPIYEEIVQDETQANRFSYELEKKIVNNPHHRRGEAAGKLLVAGLALQSATSVYACDKTLYLFSSGKVCDNSICTNVNMYSIPIQTGSTICFNTMNGKTLEVRIDHSKAMTRYQASYYACDYKMTTQTTWECKNPAGYCWNGGSCTAGYRHPAILKVNEIYPHGYGCQPDSIGCDEWCWHQTSCTWYSWVIKPIMERCYKVYHKVSEIWQTSVYIKSEGIVKHIKLSTNNPKHNLNGYDIEGLKDLPIIITGFSHEALHLRNSIVTVGSIGYAVDASMPNFPVKNTIGEYQMSLDKESFTTHTSMATCEMRSCKGNCSHDEPAVNRLDTAVSSKIPTGQLFRNGDMTLKRFIPVIATATLVIGSIEIDSLKITPSECKISLESTMACTGCDTKPTAIFKAYDIKTEGLITYESNCSWVQDVMSCNPEPYSMALEETSDVCALYISSTNQTIIIHFDYVFEGKLSLLKTYYAESMSEAVVGVISDKNFWGSLIGSLNIMAFMSVGTVALVKVARLGIAFKTKKDMTEV